MTGLMLCLLLFLSDLSMPLCMELRYTNNATLPITN